MYSNLKPMGAQWVRALTLAVLCVATAAASVRAAPTTVEEARKAVAGWLKEDPRPLDSQLGAEVGKAEAYQDAAGQALYYVVSLSPSGFVIVPADDWVTPIVAFSSEGVFDPSPANPLGALVTRDVPARVQAARNAQTANAAASDPNAEGKWAELIGVADGTITTGLTSVSDMRVSPLVASKWNQQTECSANCYNYYTPNNYPTGCVATALAQLLRFYQYPTSGIGVRTYTIKVNGVAQTAYTRGGDGAGGPYNWAQMPLDPDCTLTTTQRQAIGAILFDAGATVNMEYSAGSSGADVFKLVDSLLNVFGYSSGIKGYNSGSNLGSALNTMVNPNLDAGYPAVLGIDGPVGGHAVIADGYGYNSSTLYHHLNMGWGGIDDAWYNLPTIDASYTFNVVDVALYNIYLTGTGEIISGRVTDLGGNPISGATVTATRAGGGLYTDTSDSRGVYAFGKIPAASSYTISVAKIGYQFGTQVVTTGTSSHWGTSCGNKWGINFAATNGQPPQASGASVSTAFNVPLTITLAATDDGVPNPPGALTYIIKTLPAHGTLSVPGGANIATVPFNLPGGGNQAIYTPTSGYSGADSFGFAASDGGTPPSGGESNTATISIDVTACGLVGIGTGSIQWELPMDTYYHDARTQVIYLASEIGRSGNITSLALNVTTVPGQTMSFWTIRMKHTSLSTYTTTGFENTGWTVVYQANEPVGSTGWRTFTFTTPFAYNGTSNLMVDFSFNNASFTNNWGICAASSPGGNRTVYLEADSWYGDPLNWPTGAPAPTASTNVPDVRLNICAAQNLPTPPSSLTHTAQSISSITWGWADNSSNEDGFYGHDASEVLKWSAAVNATSYLESGLATNTQYTRHVHAYNGSGSSAASNSASAYTAIEASSGVAFGAVTTTSIEVKSVNIPSNLTAGVSGLIVRNKTTGADSGWKQNNNFWAAASLTANTGYSFAAQSRNGDGDTTTEGTSTTKSTLPVAPSAQCNQAVGCPAQAVGTVYTFTNNVGFTGGGVNHYHYVWDRNPTYTFSGSESTWTASTLAVTANQTGSWYLHLMSHNAEHASGGTANLGPFVVMTTGGYAPGDLDWDCDVDQDDLTYMIYCGSGPGIAQNDPDCTGARIDGDTDVDSIDFARFQRCWTGSGGIADPACGN